LLEKKINLVTNKNNNKTCAILREIQRDQIQSHQFEKMIKAEKSAQTKYHTIWAHIN
jgi:hypothetical protein